MSRILLFIIVLVFCSLNGGSGAKQELRFNPKNGQFKIMQLADMHYSADNIGPCQDILPNQFAHCTANLNTTDFINRLIEAEKPDLIVFTGDNIDNSTDDAVKSMNAAFAPVIKSKIPWVAVLGNHDQASTLSREDVMKHIVGMENTLSQLNPDGVDFIDGFGNFNLQVLGDKGSSYVNESLLNLYFLDSGDYSTVPSVPGYGWIEPSQQYWLNQTSEKLLARHKAPGLAYFHIPLPEHAKYTYLSNFTGVCQEDISSASVHSGFFDMLADGGHVKAVFTGHDHINDYCGSLDGIHLCYGGGVGYNGYGKARWSRRARMVLVSLDKGFFGEWGDVESIKTWKRLDDDNLTAIDGQVLWRLSRKPRFYYEYLSDMINQFLW